MGSMMNTIRQRAIFLVFTILAIGLAVVVSNMFDCNCHNRSGVAHGIGKTAAMSMNATSPRPSRINA